MKTENLAIQKDVVRPPRIKILHWDAEISPILGWAYNPYEGPLIRLEQDPKVVSVAWWWEGEKRIHCATLADFPNYKPDRFNIDDSQLVAHIHGLLMDADVLVGHNATAFDYKIANARFLHYGLEPLDQKYFFDTLTKARRHFKMPKNTLDEIYRYIFGKEGKTKIKHSDVIWDCLEGDMGAWLKMKKYNIRDVEITRDVYFRIKPFCRFPINMNLLLRGKLVCTSCGSENFERTPRSKYLVTTQRFGYKCLDCFHKFYGDAQRDGLDRAHGTD